MKKLIILFLALFPMLLSASMIDPLYDFDYTRIGIKGLYLTGGPEANLNNAMYDKDGKKVDKYISQDFSYKSTDIYVPLRLGYAFDGRYSAGVVVPIVSLDQTSTIAGTDYQQTNFGMGNPWVWFRGCLFDALAPYLRLRLGAKLPFGAYTLEDQMKDIYDNRTDPSYKPKALTGDKSLAFDLAAVYTYRELEKMFRLDGQLALRYNLEGTYTYDVATSSTNTASYEDKLTPGMMLDFRAMPGIAFCSNKSVETYLWLEYAMQLSDTVLKETVDSVTAPNYKISGESMFTTGIRADYLVDSNNTVELKFLYDVMTTGGKSSANTSYMVPAGMSVGLGYFGYIPF